MSDETRKILEEGRSFFAAGNWRQGNEAGYYYTGPTCVGVYLNDRCETKDHPAYQAFKQAVGWTQASLINWNDDPKRTLQDVLDGFDRALAAL